MERPEGGVSDSLISSGTYSRVGAEKASGLCCRSFRRLSCCPPSLVKVHFDLKALKL